MQSSDVKSIMLNEGVQCSPSCGITSVRHWKTLEKAVEAEKSKVECAGTLMVSTIHLNSR